AVVLAGAGLAAGLWRLAHRQSVPDHVLLVALAVWLPILMIGFFRWTIPPRYAEAQILPLLIGAFATAQWAAQSVVQWRRRAATTRDATPVLRAALAIAVCALVVNPRQVAAA